EELRRAARREEALERYQDAFTVWMAALKNYASFRQDSITQEDIYELQLKYLRLISELRGTQLKRAGMLLTYLTGASTRAAGAADWLLLAQRESSPGVAMFPVAGPLDGLDPDGQPWISEMHRNAVKSRLPGYKPSAPPAGREVGWQGHSSRRTPSECRSGESPPEEISEVRRAEGAHAAAVVGAAYHCLEERDLLVTYGERALERVTRLIREVRARIVLTHSPADYMLDHEMTSAVTRAAAFAAP